MNSLSKVAKKFEYILKNLQVLKHGGITRAAGWTPQIGKPIEFKPIELEKIEPDIAEKKRMLDLSRELNELLRLYDVEYKGIFASDVGHQVYRIIYNTYGKDVEKAVGFF